MVFEEISRKVPKTESDRISAMVNDRPVEPKLKWAIFDEFEEKSRKLPKTELTVSRQRYTIDSGTETRMGYF
jgi:hypothetical protein